MGLVRWEQSVVRHMLIITVHFIVVFMYVCMTLFVCVFIVYLFVCVCVCVCVWAGAWRNLFTFHHTRGHFSLSKLKPILHR